ncbi:MAG: hypothetical protein U0Q15_03720 [Kineosporiaceae bacterium]
MTTWSGDETTDMGRVSSRRHRRAHAFASALAVLALYAGYLSLPSAAAAWTSATGNATSFGSGTVTITDDDGGVSRFVTTLITTTSGTTSKCLAVTYGGSAAASVKFYATVGGDSGVRPYTTFTVEEGTGGSNSSCSGFSATSTLASTTLNSWTATSYATGLSSWAPSASQTRTYRLSLALNGSTPLAQQGSQITLALTWEARAGT